MKPKDYPKGVWTLPPTLRLKIRTGRSIWPSAKATA